MLVSNSCVLQEWIWKGGLNGGVGDGYFKNVVYSGCTLQIAFTSINVRIRWNNAQSDGGGGVMVVVV